MLNIGAFVTPVKHEIDFRMLFSARVNFARACRHIVTLRLGVFVGGYRLGGMSLNEEEDGEQEGRFHGKEGLT